MAYKRISPQPVIEGATGQVTLTNHGVLVGATTTGITQLAVGATNSVLQGTTATDPAFTTTPTVTSLRIGSGSTLSTFTDWTLYTPTLLGATTSGTTTYTSQVGYWMQVGNIVVVQFKIVITAATGTGTIVISLPVTSKNVTSLQNICAVKFSSPGKTWSAGYTSLVLFNGVNTATITMQQLGSLKNTLALAIANTAMNVSGTISYQV